MPAHSRQHQVLLALALTAALVLVAGPAMAADAPKDRDPLPPGLEQAIDRGLFFLQKQQKPNGSFDAASPANASAGLGLMAFLAAGHMPDPNVGKYGLAARHALDYLVNLNPDNGYYGADGGRMYSHCIVTIALAEACGMESDEAQRKKLRAALDKAIKVICDAQDVRKDKDAAGGWRYEPTTNESDLSVSGWAIVALRACQDAGMNLPKDRADRAAAYVLHCFRQDQGGFAYQPGQEASMAMTGSAILSLHLLDAGERPQVAAATRFLIEKPVKLDQYGYYTLYSRVQAGSQAGDKAWTAAWRHACEQLLPTQRKDDGSWLPRGGAEPAGEHKPGRFYPTAMSCLTLSVPLRLLPMYQR